MEARAAAVEEVTAAMTVAEDVILNTVLAADAEREKLSLLLTKEYVTFVGILTTLLIHGTRLKTFKPS